MGPSERGFSSGVSTTYGRPPPPGNLLGVQILRLPQAPRIRSRGGEAGTFV